MEGTETIEVDGAKYALTHLEDDNSVQVIDMAYGRVLFVAVEGEDIERLIEVYEKGYASGEYSTKRRVRNSL